MNLTQNAAELLLLRAKVPKPFALTVLGSSMLPVLREGDTISVCRKDTYELGDILVFVYRHSEVLVHRLLKIEKEHYVLKGDNAFRLEIVPKERIVGTVLLKNDPHRTPEFVQASYEINRLFTMHGYDVERTKLDPIYHNYLETYGRT